MENSQQQQQGHLSFSSLSLSQQSHLIGELVKDSHIFYISFEKIAEGFPKHLILFGIWKSRFYLHHLQSRFRALAALPKVKL